MEKKPLVSIVTVCYNSEKTIRDTIESVLNQTYRNIEYILVDGASKDSTVDIIKSYEEKFREKGISYKWISEPDTGIYNAMNKGIDMASGEWCYFLGSDDILFDKNVILSITNELLDVNCIYYGEVYAVKKRILYDGAFNVGGIPDMVVHKGNGYLSDYKDSNDLMRGIDWCLNNLEKVRLRNVNLEKEKSINILLEIYKK